MLVMTCQEDVIPIFVIVTVFVILFLSFNALRGFTIYEQYHKNRLKEGLPWETSIAEYSDDLARIKSRFGKMIYLVSYVYVILTIELFDRPYRALIVVSVLLLAALRLLLVIC